MPRQGYCHPHVLLTPEAMKNGRFRLEHTVVISEHSVVSKIVPALAGPPERYFRSKERPKNGFGAASVALLGDGRITALS